MVDELDELEQSLISAGDTSDDEILALSATPKRKPGRPPGKKPSTPRAVSNLEDNLKKASEERKKQNVKIATEFLSQKANPLVVTASRSLALLPPELVYKSPNKPGNKTFSPEIDLTPLGQSLALSPFEIDILSNGYASMVESPMGAVLMNQMSKFIPYFWIAGGGFVIVSHGMKVMTIRKQVQSQLQAQMEQSTPNGEQPDINAMMSNLMNMMNGAGVPSESDIST